MWVFVVCLRSKAIYVLEWIGSSDVGNEFIAESSSYSSTLHSNTVHLKGMSTSVPRNICKVCRPSDKCPLLGDCPISTPPNNQAEYFGLLVGLRVATSYQWPALEVVGDSALIIRQLRDHRPPLNPRLLALYKEARRLSDRLDVQRWSHHIWEHNRMAYSLANLAMDARASSLVQHPTTRPGHDGLHVHLGEDLSPWVADTLDTHVDSYL